MQLYIFTSSSSPFSLSVFEYLYIFFLALTNVHNYFLILYRVYRNNIFLVGFTWHTFKKNVMSLVTRLLTLYRNRWSENAIMSYQFLNSSIYIRKYFHILGFNLWNSILINCIALLVGPHRA